MDEKQTEQLNKLREAIGRSFNLEALHGLAFELGVPIDDLPGETLDAKILALIDYQEQQGHIPDLLDKLIELRPDEPWPNLIPTEPKTESNEVSLEGVGDLFDGVHLSDIQGSAVALGRGATATVYQGLSLDEVAQLVIKLKNKAQPPVWDGRNPYLGLTAFRESDAQFFFGRESLVEDLLRRVQGASFISIAGPSGSGKSSVARAGLFHALREGRIERSESWLLGTMQPKGNPIEALALGLERMVGRPEAANYIREQSLTNPFALSKQVESLLDDDQRQRCVLLIDQFEEIFTQTKDENQRAAFIDLLTTAAGEENGRTIIILALRSDFVSQCAGFSELRTLMSKQFQLVGAMEPPDLAKAISLPALEVGAEIDPALVKQIMDDMKGEPGALPLMSFALRNLFESEKSQQGHAMDLTLPEYLYRGGIEQALEQHTTKVFSNFSEEQQALAETIFSKLIDVGEGRVDTRRTAVIAELVPSGKSIEAVSEVIGELAGEDARLITVSGVKSVEELKAGDNFQVSVTLAHEKMIDAWPWLRNLVDENRDWLRFHRRLTQDTREWLTSGRDVSLLYRGGKLAQVQEQTAEHLDELNQDERAFIQASVQEEKRITAEREAQRQRELAAAQELAEARQGELEAQQRRTTIVRRAVVGLSLLLVTAIITTIIAISASGQASDEAANAITSEAHAQAAATNAVAAQGTAEAEAVRADKNLAAAQTAEAVAVTEADRALESAELAAEKEAEAIFQAQIAQSQALAISWQNLDQENPMEALLLAIASGKTAETGLAMDALNQQLTRMARPISNITHEDIFFPSGAVWNKNNDRVITWGGRGFAWVWDVTNPDQPLFTLTHEHWVNGAIWNGIESQILTWSVDRTVKVWDVTNPDQPLFTLTHEDAVNGAVWNEVENSLLTWSDDGTARVWDTADPSQPLLTMTHGDRVIGAVWNSTEDRILTWGCDESGESGTCLAGSVRVWDTADASQPLITLAHEGFVSGAAWNEMEDQVLSWRCNEANEFGVCLVGIVSVWETADPSQPIATLTHDGRVLGAAWNMAGDRILTWSEDGTARVWDTAEPDQPLFTLTHASYVMGALWNGVEDQILTWSIDGTAKVWDTANSSQPLLTLNHAEWVHGADWNKAEDRILTWSEDGTARIWDVAAPGQPLLTITHEGPVLDAVWNEEEAQLLTRSEDGTVKVWDVTIPSQSLVTLPHSGPVIGAVWNTAEDSVLEWGCDDWDNNFDCNMGTVRLWDLTNPGKPLFTITHEDWVLGALWNKAEDRILNWGFDGTVEVWDTADLDQPVFTLVHNNPVIGAVWNVAEDNVLTWGVDNTVRVWNTTNPQQPVFTLAHDEGPVWGAAWNEAETRISTWGEDGTVRVWDVNAPDQPLLTLTHESPVINIVWNEAENLVLTQSSDTSATVWDAADPGQPLFTLNHDDTVLGGVWNKTADLILTWSEDETARVWDAADPGQPLFTLNHDDTVLGGVWNKTADLILTWSEDGTASVWDVTAPDQPLITLTHEDWVSSATWNEAENRILTWSRDGTASVWDAETGELLLNYHGDGSNVTTARWNQDESRILLATENGLIRIYYTSTKELAKHACQYATRNFTWEEWLLYFPSQPYEITCPQWPVHPSVPQSAH